MLTEHRAKSTENKATEPEGGQDQNREQNREPEEQNKTEQRTEPG